MGFSEKDHKLNKIKVNLRQSSDLSTRTLLWLCPFCIVGLLSGLSECPPTPEVGWYATMLNQHCLIGTRYVATTAEQQVLQCPCSEVYL